MIEKLCQAIGNVYKHSLRQGQTSSKLCRKRDAAKTCVPQGGAPAFAVRKFQYEAISCKI